MESTTVSTEKWTQIVKENAYMKKALDHLMSCYHRALEDHLEGVSIRDIAVVIEISEAEREVEII